MSSKEKKLQSKQNQKYNQVAERFERAKTLQLAGRLSEAESIYNYILSICPDHPDALNFIGVIHTKLGKTDEAIKILERSILVNPGNPWAYCNLGNAESIKGNKDKAAEYYITALRLNPNDINIFANLGLILTDAGRYNEAMGYYRQALNISNNHPLLWDSLGNTLQKMGDLEGAITAYRNSLVISPNIETHSNLILAMNYSSKCTASDLFSEARKWANIYAPESLIMPPSIIDKTPNRKLRIGYVSADLIKHPVAYSLKNTLANHDKENFEIFCYSNLPKEDDYTALLKENTDGWKEIFSLSDKGAAEQIRKDKIDILIDLSGHTANNRLGIFAHRPAPIQATWIGYMGTTGMRQMDYIICDQALVSPGLSEFITEKFMIVPERLASIDLPDCEAEVSLLPALKNGRLTFGCFNNLYKISKETIKLWARIMNEVTDSVLYLKAGALKDEVVIKSFYDSFAEYGISPERLRLEGRSSRAEYYAAHNEMDIALDPFPYNGGTTTVDALWMGVPVISLAGEKMTARSGASILAGVGYPEFITENEEEYFIKAVSLAKDLDKLSSIRKSMRENLQKSPLFDGARITKNIEGQIRAAWLKYCST